MKLPIEQPGAFAYHLCFLKNTKTIICLQNRIFSMLKTYLTLAFRQLRKHPLYSAINILGLSVGIAIVLVLGCYLHFETSYESSHEKADQLYLVNSNLYAEEFDAY